MKKQLEVKGKCLLKDSSVNYSYELNIYIGSVLTY